MLRVGYSFWGFLGDKKVERGQEVSTPDGNATYSWSVVWEMLRRGWKVWSMQRDRDEESWCRDGWKIFESFSQQKRGESYCGTYRTFGEELPELDVLLVEWRWPIPGRNCLAHLWEYAGELRFDDRLQPDLKRQLQLLEHYRRRKTRVVLWDLDHKLSLADEMTWEPHAVFETSVRPIEGFSPRVRVEPPTVVADLLQFPTLPADPRKKLAYVGSRYERDDVIEEWILPVAREWPGQVRFYGKWEDRPGKPLWSEISYSGRITTSGFRAAYGDAVACPLLAKRSYLETGFVTPRVWEALLFGTVPVGLGSHRGISGYVQPGLIAGDGNDMVEIVETLTGIPLAERDRIRRENVEDLDHMDSRHFVDRVEEVYNGVVAKALEEEGA